MKKHITDHSVLCQVCIKTQATAIRMRYCPVPSCTYTTLIAVRIKEMKPGSLALGCCHHSNIQPFATTRQLKWSLLGLFLRSEMSCFVSSIGIMARLTVHVGI